MPQRWGDVGYAMDELVGELRAAFIGADHRLTREIRKKRASYVHSWREVLNGDQRALYRRREIPRAGHLLLEAPLAGNSAQFGVRGESLNPFSALWFQWAMQDSKEST